MASPKVTRFYGISAIKPFLHVLDEDIHVNSPYERYKVTKANDPTVYWPIGTYKYVGKNTFFLAMETTAASGLPKEFFKNFITDIDHVIPPDLIQSQPDLKTATVTLQMTQEEAAVMKATVANPDAATPSRIHQITVASFVINTPELCSTRGLAVFMKDFFGSDYEICQRKCLLSKQENFCTYATSEPDSAIIHKHKYVINNCIQAAQLDPLLDPLYCREALEFDGTLSAHTIVGDSNEDKKCTNGESQCIAGMIELTACVGIRAVKAGKFFNKAVMYGSVRNLDDDDVVPYKLIMYFKNRDVNILRSRNSMNSSQYIAAVKYILQNPENFC